MTTILPFPESKLDWLVEKFGQHQGWFNAAEIRKKGDKRYKAGDWKKLMELAVKEVLVYSSDSYPEAPKDSIAFNLPEISEFFDSEIFDDPFFTNPLESMVDSMEPDDPFFTNPFGSMSDLMKPDDNYFSLLDESYDIYNLLCGLQYHEKYDDLLLPETHSNERKKNLVRRARMIANTYSLVKFGWSEILEAGYFSRHKYICPVDYNELFLRILCDMYRFAYFSRKERIDKEYKVTTRLRLAQSIQKLDDINTEAAVDENLKNLRKSTGQPDHHIDTLWNIGASSSCKDIKEILKNSSNPLVKEAMKELKLIPGEEQAAQLKKLRKDMDEKPLNKN